MRRVVFALALIRALPVAAQTPPAACEGAAPLSFVGCLGTSE